ncbi:MAG: hypothetical protein GY804_05860 [Alphaproteobacteria bacterium]|nr:hypothetical protein [Alphaproteobacteria bacterium]
MSKDWINRAVDEICEEISRRCGYGTYKNRSKKGVNKKKSKEELAAIQDELLEILCNPLKKSNQKGR